MLPPWWMTAIAAVPLVALGVAIYRWVARDEKERIMRVGESDLRGARARSVAAAIVFTLGAGLAGWLSWLLAMLPPREVVFGVVWVLVSLYFVVAAGTFKTQMGRFGTTAAATARHLLQAMLWGPIMVLMLLPRRDPPPE